MDEGSSGALLPAVKPNPRTSASFAGAATASSFRDPLSGDAVAAGADAGATEVDKYFLCRICMQTIKDAFLTACGHNFCYMCIITHLRNKSDCHCCSHFLTTKHLYPNFLLDNLLKKTCARQISKMASPVEHFRLALQRGCDVSMKELDTLLALLAEKKRKMKQEEAERNIQILLDFLHCLRKQKVKELNEVQTDLRFVKEDISSMKRHSMDLYHARERYSLKLQTGGDDLSARKPWHSSIDKDSSGPISSPLNLRGGISSGSLQIKKLDGRGQVNSAGLQRKDSLSRSDSQHINQSGMAVVRKKQVHAQFNDLQECYLQKLRQLANQSYNPQVRVENVIHRAGYNAGLANFQSVLSTFTRYSRLRVIAELRHGDLFHSANIVSRL